MNIRIFHQIVLQEEWLNFPEKPFIFNNDLPRDTTITPKFISQDVLIQLKRHLHCLNDWMQRFILVLLETGRRVSEVSLLKFAVHKYNTAFIFNKLFNNKAML